MKYLHPLKLILIVTFLFTATIPSNAQFNTDKLFAFLQETYNQHDKKLHEFLVIELNQFVKSFPDSANVADACFVLAKVYQEKGKKHEALATYYKTMFLYPNFSKHKECADIVREIIAKERAYRDKKEKLAAILDGEFTGETTADKYYFYLNFLMELDESKLFDWTLAETRQFFYQFPNYVHIDTVVKWIADLYAKKGDGREAAVSYLKLGYTHPDSPLLPYSLYSRSMLLYQKLGKYEAAMNVFEQIISVYPESEYASASFFMLGEIKEKKMKDYEGAITDYRKLVDTNPQYKKSVYALLAIADIYSKKKNDYPAAIAAYNEIIEKYQTHSLGVSALEKIGDIYKDKLKDYKKSAEYYAKIAELYPAYEKAPDMLLKAGTVCEDKLNDYKKAIEYYQLVVDKYSEHKKASTAQKRLSKAKYKMGK